MRAVVRDRCGSPDVLELREIDRPPVGPGEVLLRVRAAGVGRHLRAALLSPLVSQTLRGFFARLQGEDLETLRELVEAGELSPVVSETFALTEAADAVRRVGEGHATGKVVVRV